MFYKWETAGHNKQLSNIERDIKDDNVAHSYLFSGPGSVGKFRIAKIFANILQCSNGFCRSCRDCKLIKNNVHPDTIFINDNGEKIKIDEIRNLIHKTNLTSYGRYRIIVIENIERMLTEAQNSFLKILEEPPGNTVFLMTTTKINHVLPTVQSRTRQCFFYNVEDNILKTYLREKFDENDCIDEAVNMAQGRPGLAINLINNPILLKEQRDLYNQIEFFLKKNDLSRKFIFAEALDKDAEKMELFFDVFSRYLRKLIYDYLKQADYSLKTRFSLKDISDMFEYLEETRYLIERNTNKRLALENLFLKTEK